MRKLALALLLLSGCQLLYGDDNDAGIDPCGTGSGGGGGAVAPLELRNPYTGECIYSYGGHPGPCGEDLPQPAADQWIDYTWALCSSGCEGLDEGTCLVADGCRGIYGADLTASGTGHFAACWGTAQDGPVRGGDCAAITDAQECSRHDDCVAIHADRGDRQIGEFLRCSYEPRLPNPAECAYDEQCGPGYRCNEEDICLPPPGCQAGDVCDSLCYGVCVPTQPQELCTSDEQCGPGTRCNAAEVCLPPPGCGANSNDMGCVEVCYGTCVPEMPQGCVEDWECGPGARCDYNVDPGWCCGGNGCEAFCGGICVPDQQLCLSDFDCAPEEQCVAQDCAGGDCGQFGVCVPRDPNGACWSDDECAPDEYCNRELCLPPPGCDPNTGEACPPVCYGGCVPRDIGPVPACEVLDEASCVDRTDGCHDFTSPSDECGDICAPNYVGDGCSCQGDVCECTSWEFAGCSGLGFGPE